MKKSLGVLTVVLVSVFFLFPIVGESQVGPGMMGGYGGGYCPNWGHSYGYGMGPGMMGYGYGMGPWMMGPGYGMGPGMMGPGYGYGYGYNPEYQRPEKPLGENEVKEMLENYLTSTRNPNLKLGKITEKGAYYEAEIVTKNNSLVDKILVDRYTGWMRSEY
jgi:hypothetical protein